MAFEMTECPHCKNQSKRRIMDHINVDKQPEMRDRVRDLSCFRWVCPVCGKTSLVVDACLYHDMSEAFMVWLLPDGKPTDAPAATPLADYQLRYVTDMNSFREKIAVLELGLDDRALEIMKLLLLVQLQTDLDVVELLFHGLDDRTGTFTFVAVLSDGAEQYVTMPGTTYTKIALDVAERLRTDSRTFIKVDLNWAKGALEALYQD
jgi:hypothetical protein